MEEIEGFHLSPRSPPSRRYSRRSGEDNGRRRGDMCHGSVAIAVRAALEAAHQYPRRNSILKERLTGTMIFCVIYRKNMIILLE